MHGDQVKRCTVNRCESGLFRRGAPGRDEFSRDVGGLGRDGGAAACDCSFHLKCV